MTAVPNSNCAPDRDYQRYLIKLAQSGDEDAKDRLVQDNMPLVASIVQRFAYGNIEREDLMQIGVLGLIKAINNFDLTYDNAFSTYAVPRIMGEIRRSLRDDNPVYVCRSLKEQISAINKCIAAFHQKYGRDATLQEIASELGISIEQVSEAQNAALLPASLYQPLGADGGELADKLENKNENDDNWLLDIDLRDSIASLPERLQFVMRERYFAEKTQLEIAKRLGVSQVQVSRMEKQALQMLKEKLNI